LARIVDGLVGGGAEWRFTVKDPFLAAPILALADLLFIAAQETDRA
jgi:hypothetical protein